MALLSSHSTSSTLDYGTWICLYGGKDLLETIQLQVKATTQNRLGIFHHEDMAQSSFGQKIYARNTQKWMVLLPCSPDLMTQSRFLRTQIVYHADASLILILLNARPGSILAEAGTGSASLTSYLAQGIDPKGHLYTFEFHYERWQQASKEIERYGQTHCVTSIFADVCENGFQAWLEKNSVDGIFLDIPSPWLATNFSDEVLKPGGRIVTLSPCIEQVQKTYSSLEKLQYYDLRTFDIGLKPWGISIDGKFKKRIVEKCDSKIDSELSKSFKKQKLETPLNSHKDFEIQEGLHSEKDTAHVQVETVKNDSDCEAHDNCSTSTQMLENEITQFMHYGLSMRIHTAYLTVGTKPPEGDADLSD